MKVKDIVIPIRSDKILRSALSTYTHAIVASIEPFILISQEGDMIWRRHDIYDFVALGEVHPKYWKNVIHRLELEATK